MTIKENVTPSTSSVHASNPPPFNPNAFASAPVVDEPEIAVAELETTTPIAPLKATVVSNIPETAMPVTAATTTTTTISTSTAVVPMQINRNRMGRDPLGMKCPYCDQEMVTRTSDQIDGSTLVAVGFLLCFGCWCCAPCPLCMQSCKTTEHYCGRCHRKIGKQSMMS